MLFMLPSIIAALANVFVLTSIYFYLFLQYRERYMGVWALSWLSYFLRISLEIGGAGSVSLPLAAGTQLLSHISAFFFLWGTHIFIGRKIPWLWYYSFGAGFLWLILGSIASFPFQALSFPIFALNGAVFVWTGFVFLRYPAITGSGKQITGWSLVLWGLHKLNYPFLRPIPWFAPWGFIIAALLALISAIGIILIYFQRVRKELHKSSLFNRMLFSTANDAVFVAKKMEGGLPPRLVDANDAACQKLGYTREELLRMSCIDLLALESEHDLPAALQALFTTKHALFETACRTKEGREIPVEVSARLFDFEGETFLLCLARDIADRKQAEDALKRRQREISTLLDSLPAHAFFKDAEGVYITANREFLETVGLSRDSIAGKTDYDLFPPASAGKYRNDDALVIRTGETLYVGEEEKTDRGRDITVVTRKVPLKNEQGEVTGLIGLSFDITELKKTERELRRAKEYAENLIETANGLIIGLDRKGNITVFNKTAETVTGYRKSEVGNRNWFEILVPKDRYPSAWELFTRWKAGEALPETFENPILTRSGEERHISWQNGEIVEGGVSVGTISFGIDITAHKKLEEQLFHSQKMEAVGQLAGGIAHDFNNILTVIMSFGNLLMKKTRENDTLKTYVDQILSASEKGTHLTQSLLAFSRRQIINPKQVNLNDMVSKIRRLLLMIIGEDIEIRMTIADSDLPVMADAGQIEQVLMNLCTNARDAMPEGGILHLETGALRIDERYMRSHGYGRIGMYAVISVTDTGMGMDEKTRERIFEPFFTTKEQGKGTGLGLAMAYGIVKQHNGYINVYSEPGRGSTFRIYLPLIKNTPLRADLLAAMDTQQPGGAETLLLVEDDASTRTALRLILEEAGFTVIEAADGSEALEKVTSRTPGPDLVLLDIIMPKMNGKEAYERIRAVRPDIKAIFISGYTADIIHQKGILEEGLHFLSKPAAPRDLLKKIREVLDTEGRG
ncbi:MAG: PAS domain S-box protein [Alphaproteobacteria bacterium]|uniref:histidine kinase n=1 Tax=Candidatus Nitrobium versatile TaxID=2884831 RepID=A0A953M1F7_9BACT|nr:PAS domain S-box protein [Candidatus Nitrobium versatile]